MIDWGDTPAGSTAYIYWPQVGASTVLQLASQLYTTRLLSTADSHTIQWTVNKGVTYVPIPPGTGQNLAGLFTVDLPSSPIKELLLGGQLSKLVRQFKDDPTLVWGF